MDLYFFLKVKLPWWISRFSKIFYDFLDFIFSMIPFFVYWTHTPFDRHNAINLNCLKSENVENRDFQYFRDFRDVRHFRRFSRFVEFFNISENFETWKFRNIFFLKSENFDILIFEIFDDFQKISTFCLSSCIEHTRHLIHTMQ